MGASIPRALFLFFKFEISTFVHKWNKFSFMDDVSISRQQLASKLFSLRSEQGLSLDELAKKSGVSRATLSRIENAEVSPTADTLSVLCASFGIPLSRLIALTEESFPALIPFEDQTEAFDEDSSLTRRTISPPSPHLLASAEESHLPPARHVELVGHAGSGQEIHLIVLDGALTLRLEDQDHDLTAGDCIRYKEHGVVTLQTPATRGARFLTIRVS